MYIGEWFEYKLCVDMPSMEVNIVMNSGHSLLIRVDHLCLKWQINYTRLEPVTLHAKQFIAQNGQ